MTQGHLLAVSYETGHFIQTPSLWWHFTFVWPCNV